MLAHQEIYTKILSVSEDLKGIHKIWLLRDNFLAEMYRKNCKKVNGLYMKTHFEVTPFCSSKYSDKNTNVLSHIVNSFTEALNAKYYLPEFIIIFLDDDLIQFLQYKCFNVATLLGPWVKHLSQIISESLAARFQDLSPKSRPKE